jgi:hypothetical protein
LTGRHGDDDAHDLVTPLTIVALIDRTVDSTARTVCAAALLVVVIAVGVVAMVVLTLFSLGR